MMETQRTISPSIQIQVEIQRQRIPAMMIKRMTPLQDPASQMMILGTSQRNPRSQSSHSSQRIHRNNLRSLRSRSSQNSQNSLRSLSSPRNLSNQSSLRRKPLHLLSQLLQGQRNQRGQITIHQLRLRMSLMVSNQSLHQRSPGNQKMSQRKK